MVDFPDSRMPSVLLAFRAQNVRSFREPMEISLLATSLGEPTAVRKVPWHTNGGMVGVVPVAGIFGANGSGKTNALRAMDDMRSLVLQSFRLGSPTGGISRRPFLLDEESLTQPSRFEVDLVLDGVRHEYGFVVSDEAVLEEWAIRYPHGKPALLFERTGEAVHAGAGARAKTKAVLELLRPNALFLSTAASANHPTLLPLYAWFQRNLILAEAGSRTLRQAVTVKLLEETHTRQPVLSLLRAADLGVTGAKRRRLDPVIRERLQQAMRILLGEEAEAVDLPEDAFEEFGVLLTHQGARGDVEFAAEDESLGTHVWFSLVGPVVKALSDGSVFLADELDASLHPALVAQLIGLFQSPATNRRRAQLVFNSHDASILGDSTDRLIGRDQIWFTEKRRDGSTQLYPLSDMDPRKAEAVGRRYLAGRYGAIPILSAQEFEASIHGLDFEDHAVDQA